MRRGVLAAGLLAVALSSPLRSAPSDEPALARGESYPGAFFLYQIRDLTVVYPGGPGDDVETNRRSAEARARHLTVTRGTRTRVVADVDATAADRAGNLLLLGWTNRLLGTEQAPRPFAVELGTLTLAGAVKADAADDLLLFNRSPYDKEKFLFFWSRIAPEDDRFMILPRIGSDWAVYRGTKVIKQGMFVPGGAWPPVVEPKASIDREALILLERGRLAELATPHYDIRYDASRIDAEQIRAIGRARESAFAKAVQALGSPGERFRVTLFVYDDEATMTDKTGVDDAAHSVPAARELHMVRRLARLPAPHEEYHLIARALYGPAVLSSLYEGLAYALDRTVRGLDLEVHAALLLGKGSWPALESILDEETFRAMPEPLGPVAAGLVCAWLREIDGGGAFPSAYRIRDGSVAALAAAIGKPAGDVEPAFRAWVERRAKARASDVAFIEAEGRAADRLAASDFPGVVAALREALRHRPGDPQTLFNLGSALMRANAMDEAAATFRDLLAAPLGPKDSRFRIFSHYQIGRILDIQGRRDEALAAYRKVLELPDEHDAHRLAEERIASPATREQLE